MCIMRDGLKKTDLICCLCHTYIPIFLLIGCHVCSQIQLLRQDIMSYKAYYTYSNALKNARKQKSLNFIFLILRPLLFHLKNVHILTKNFTLLSL